MHGWVIPRLVAVVGPTHRSSLASSRSVGPPIGHPWRSAISGGLAFWQAEHSSPVLAEHLADVARAALADQLRVHLAVGDFALVVPAAHLQPDRALDDHLHAVDGAEDRRHAGVDEVARGIRAVAPRADAAVRL